MRDLHRALPETISMVLLFLYICIYFGACNIQVFVNFSSEEGHKTTNFSL